jgi:hypothetical protein
VKSRPCRTCGAWLNSLSGQCERGHGFCEPCLAEELKQPEPCAVCVRIEARAKFKAKSPASGPRGKRMRTLKTLFKDRNGDTVYYGDYVWVENPLVHDPLLNGRLYCRVCGDTGKSLWLECKDIGSWWRGYSFNIQDGNQLELVEGDQTMMAPSWD